LVAFGRLPIEVVGALIGGTWVLVALFWAVILRWEKTGVTEARRRELEQEATEANPSVGIIVWRILINVVLVGIPLLLAIDGSSIESGSSTRRASRSSPDRMSSSRSRGSCCR
jgi:ABC-type transport system involved in cytochrome c biogenesis permease component